MNSCSHIIRLHPFQSWLIDFSQHLLADRHSQSWNRFPTTTYIQYFCSFIVTSYHTVRRCAFQRNLTTVPLILLHVFNSQYSHFNSITTIVGSDPQLNLLTPVLFIINSEIVVESKTLSTRCISRPWWHIWSEWIGDCHVALWWRKSNETIFTYEQSQRIFESDVWWRS